jgi:hypothetical protein
MTTQQTLAEIFRGASRAHYQAFAARHGSDPAWPDWYARDLAPTLSAVLGTELEQASLRNDLRTADTEMRARAPSADWTQYYAGWFLARYSSQ